MNLMIFNPEALNPTLITKYSTNNNEEPFKSQENGEAPGVCGICGGSHFYRQCKCVVITSKILNKQIPSRARLSLPENLEIKSLSDQTSSVFTTSLIQTGVEFGPFIAKRNLTLHPATPFPIKVFMNNESDLSEYYLDTVDESDCCWMMFVKPASDAEEQNLICYQEGEDIYFSSVRDIPAGEELQVWYSPYYAYKMQKNILSLKASEAELEVKPGVQELNDFIKDQQKIIPRVVWNCKFCYKLEKNVTDFAKHLLTHYIRHKKITCEICQIRFRFIADYRRHMRFAHGDSFIETDTAADEKKIKILDSSKKESKQKLSIGGPLMTECISDSLENSNSFIPKSDENLFELETYDYKNMLFESDNLRFSLDIGNSIRDFDDLELDLKNNKDPDEQKNSLCDICLKRFSSVKSLASHLRLHVGQYFCSSCKKTFGRLENLKQHKCNQTYSAKCPKCNKVFTQKKYLSKHISIYHERKFACTLCNQICYSSVELQNHRCKSNENKKLLKCTSCPKQFRSYRGLKVHVKNNHSKTPKSVDIKYICSECSETFSTKDIYKRHVASLHERTARHECRICSKVFNRSDILTKHLLHIHMIGATGIFPCPTCKKEFKSQDYLKVHLKTHTQSKLFKCDGCNTTFKFLRNLVRHTKMVHSKQELGVGDYECPVCNIKVKLKSSLQRHIRKKHPETYKSQCAEVNAKRKETKHQLYRCPICHQTRKFMASLKKHIEMKHPEEYKNACTQLGETEYLVVDKEKKKPISFDEEFDNYMDLQKTIENMDFNIDTCNENLFSGSETIDRFLKERSDQISIFCAESPKNPVNNEVIVAEKARSWEVGLSMPDLCEMDSDIKCGKNLQTNGNILESQMTINALNDVVLYVLNDNKGN
ncbi:PR domain zinc finger protein 5-like isoform X1 [Euwallacea similis]|uniref:PR domain zinc finger protein 5-like isoform X1 n=2 Tax=Euwallacea similis TaxID=1736056 RepID=UPI003450EB8E